MKKNYTNYNDSIKKKEVKFSTGEQVIMSDSEKVYWDKSPLRESLYPKKAIVISRGKLNLRKLPSFDGDVICLIERDTELLIESIEEGWAQVYTSTGLKGYVMAEFIKEV